MTKGERSRALRYKRPALATLGFKQIMSEMEEIAEACDDIRYFIESDEETLLAALDGEEEEAYEFKMAFSSLSIKVGQLTDAIYEFGGGWNSRGWPEFDDCIVALIGNRYRLVGYDSSEEDYYALAQYDAELAFTEAGKRLTRHTKAEILTIIGQALGVLIAFLDIRERYDYLKATFDILRNQNTSLLQQIKAVEAAYCAAEAVDFKCWRDETKEFDRLLDALPDHVWI